MDFLVFHKVPRKGGANKDGNSFLLFFSSLEFAFVRSSVVLLFLINLFYMLPITINKFNFFKITLTGAEKAAASPPTSL